MFLDELQKLSNDTATSLKELKNDMEYYLKNLNPDDYEFDSVDYLACIMGKARFQNHCELLEKMISSLENNKPEMLSESSNEIMRLLLDCKISWPDFEEDICYVTNIFMTCNTVETLIKERQLGIDETDLSNVCAIADAIETVSDCLKDAIYLSENGEDYEWEDAYESIENYKYILKFLMALV